MCHLKERKDRDSDCEPIVSEEDWSDSNSSDSDTDSDEDVFDITEASVGRSLHQHDFDHRYLYDYVQLKTNLLGKEGVRDWEEVLTYTLNGVNEYFRDKIGEREIETLGDLLRDTAIPLFLPSFMSPEEVQMHYWRNSSTPYPQPAHDD